jgi:predicted phosphodiesterase
MPDFDLISDIHLDFWVSKHWNLFKVHKQIHEFVQQILPPSPSKILVIAGDIGHYNDQNYIMLKTLQRYYKHILLVAGNHDYYLLTKSMQYKYKSNSINRLNEMKKLAHKLHSVTYLDGDMVRLEGLTFGGCGMWYDFQYGIQILNTHYNTIVEHWKAKSNDATLLKGKPRLTRDMFDEEKKKLSHILKESDVIITHFSPDWGMAPEGRKLQLSTSFYYFDGTPYFSSIAHKTWCFGHIHQRMDYMLHDCRFINASLGYPRENQFKPNRAVTIKIEEPGQKRRY